jgi:GT2 family glycosyltransferase
LTEPVQQLEDRVAQGIPGETNHADSQPAPGWSPTFDGSHQRASPAVRTGGPGVEGRRAMSTERPTARGKFLFAGRRHLYVRGVTYGTFRPRANGAQFPSQDVIERDFEAIAAAGFNAVRTYTVPPQQVLDAAASHGLGVMVGLPWEHHVAFLDDRRQPRSIERRVREGVRACTGHPSIICYSVGNEIPAPIVRWHGRRRVERFIERLYQAAKEEDPEGLVTYVNFPSTEYLELPFLDLVCFNVYLEQRERLDAYLARLHNLAGDRPLLMAEIGLDSRRNGEVEQARLLDWQIRAAAESGCAGAFVFSWTDEWHRGGYEIHDWDFGLTRRDRTPKPALRTAGRAFEGMPPRPDSNWPRVSVVVCSCNGARTLPDCLEGLSDLDYPDYEVIVVNDGSTDLTAAIVKEFPRCRLINTENRGLSCARNTGMRAASGEIVAYIDDDARPDRQWLSYLAHTFLTTAHAGVGGPNIAPSGDGPIAECVANAPGGPIHVLLADREAEHVPGCNMAFRKDRLEAVGGFDPQFRVAGDDVDLCWRVHQQGWTLGFTPAAMVWHHRRNSLRAYWRQQRAYGRAEALLERKWPERYNSAGHLSWGGRLYGPGVPRPVGRLRTRVHYGVWGSGLFQHLYRPATGTLAATPLMPEWYLLVGVLAVLSAAGAIWPVLLISLPFLGVALAALAVQAARGAASASFATAERSRSSRLALRALTACLFLAQPLARLSGRLVHGLTPWRHRGHARPALPRPRCVTEWNEHWRPPADRPGDVEERLLAAGAPVERGGHFDRWDLEVRGGPLGRARFRAAVEEHGAGRQLVRYRIWPVLHPVLPLAAVALVVVGALAVSAVPVVAVACVVAAVLLSVRSLYDAARAVGALLEAVAPVPYPAVPT